MQSYPNGLVKTGKPLVSENQTGECFFYHHHFQLRVTRLYKPLFGPLICWSVCRSVGQSQSCFECIFCIFKISKHYRRHWEVNTSNSKVILKVSVCLSACLSVCLSVWPTSSENADACDLGLMTLLINCARVHASVGWLVGRLVTLNFFYHFYFFKWFLSFKVI